LFSIGMISSSSPSLSLESSSSLDNDTDHDLSGSTNIRATLDPCVVLMKSMMSKYADQWKDCGGIYSLAQGVVYWKPPPAVTTALCDGLSDDQNDWHCYGPAEGLAELRAVLTEKLATENNLSCHHVMITSGANQAYMNCVLTLLQPKDFAVVFAPYYFNHVMALQMTIGPDHVLVGPPLMDDTSGIPNLVWLNEQWQCHEQRIRMVTLVNPGNPTGLALTAAQVQPLVDWCRVHNVWLILDATYEYFIHKDESEHHNHAPRESHSLVDPSAVPVSTGADKKPPNAFTACFPDAHCLHIFSLSKSYALAGYRCGYIAIPKQGDVFEQMIKVQDTIPIAPSRVAQVAALAAIQQAGPAWVSVQVATLATGRTAIATVLQKYLPLTMGGSGAMYLMGQLPVTLLSGTATDVQVAERLVSDHGVAVIPGSFCGFPGWLRVCYSNLPPEQCVLAAQRLEQGLKEILLRNETIHNAVEARTSISP
jgi:aromatic aminotransferase